MYSEYVEIRELLQQRADLQARLKLLPYDGSPEIKNRGETGYLYVRKRVAGKLTSTYVGVFSDELYAALLRYAKEARELKRNIRHIEKRLAQLGYATEELSDRVLLNIDFARSCMKANIYDQAVLEGVATSYPQTEDIIENGRVSGVSANDVQKILNLKHASLNDSFQWDRRMPNGIIGKLQEGLLGSPSSVCTLIIDSHPTNLPYNRFFAKGRAWYLRF